MTYYNYSKHNKTATSITIPKFVIKIGKNAFRNCSKLSSITIPSSVTKIGSYAFSNCSNLTSISIPNSVTKICSYAFGICTKLTSIIIPDSVIEVEPRAFMSCSNLTSISIPSLIKTSAGYINRIFYECSKLSFITTSTPVTEPDYKILLQAYKNVTQKYLVSFKEFENEVLRLDPNFKFD